MEAWQPYRVTTRNTSPHVENKIHDDVEAKRYGFKGGLVPGTAVYAHMTRPVVARYGEAWLERNASELALLKPAYEGDRLCVTVKERPGQEGSALNLSIANESDQELATLETAVAAHLPLADPLSNMTPDRTTSARIPISWDAVVVGKPMRAMIWEPNVDKQQRWCTGVSDDLPVYRGEGAPVHPGLIVQAANHVLGNHFVLKPWIHIGSRVLTRGLARLGQTYEVRAVPIERWEKKGHQFWKVYMAIVLDNRPIVEIWHSAIFGVRLAA